MSNVKITELPVLTYALGSDVLPVVSTTEGYITSQITVANLANSIASNGVTGSLLMSGSIIPAVASGSATSSFSLGSATNAWKDIYVSNGTINFLDGAGTNQGTLSSTADGLSMGALSVSTISGVNNLIPPYGNYAGTALYPAAAAGRLALGIKLWQDGPSSDGIVDYYTAGFKAANTAGNKGRLLSFNGMTGGSYWVAINDNTVTGDFLGALTSPYAVSAKNLLQVSGSFIAINGSLGTDVNSKHYIVGTTTISGSLLTTGSLSMSVATGTPTGSAVTPAGFYKATINGVLAYLPYYV